MPTPPKPIKKKVPGLRMRYQKRAGTWRVWWEPNGPQRAAGFQPVELRADAPAWSIREAQKLNLQAADTPTSTPRKGPVAKNSIDWICAEYQKSPRFLQLSEKTKLEYRKDIARILERWQGTNVKRLTKPTIYTWYETLFAAHGVYVSRRLVKMLSILMSYAELRGRIPVNPLLRMRMITPKGRRRVATWEEFNALDQAAQDLDWPNMRLAVFLSMFMGQRVTDIVTARAADFVLHPASDGRKQLHWRLVRSKDTTLERLNYLVVHPEVQPMLSEALSAAELPHSRVVLRDGDGAVFNDTSFPTAFAQLREHAARSCPSIYDLQFRDLRRTFSNNSRHADVAGDDVDDALGNTSGTDPNLRQVYMPASDDRAAQAILAVQRPAQPKNKKRA